MKRSPKNKDVDDAMKSAEDKKATAKKLKETAAEIAPPAKGEQQAPAGQENRPDLHFQSFDVLGEDEEGRLHFWSKLNRKTYNHDLKSFQYDQLIQIGGEEVSQKVGRGKRYDPVSPLWEFSKVKEKLIKDAAKNQMGTLRYLGQGIHHLNNDRLLIVNGGHAWTWDGEIFTEHDHPLIDGKMIIWSPGRKWLDLEFVMKRVKKMTVVEAAKIAESVCELIDQWGFKDSSEAYLLSGWLLAQQVQEIWTWRPHLWLSGPAGSGKTILISLLEGLAGKLAMRREGKSLTEAGFRQDMGADAVLSFIDEFEKSESREAIIEYLRSASRGGTVVKGTTAQKAVHFHIQHMALLASIEVRLARAAERSRFLVIELQKDNSRHPTIPNAGVLEKLRHDITAYTLWASFRAKKIISDLGRIQGFEDRLVESYAVPLSMLAVCKDNALEILRNLTVNYLGKAQQIDALDHISDEEKLLRDISFAKIRIQIEHQIEDRTAVISQDYSVSQAVEKIIREGDGLCHETLQAHGLKICEEGIFLVPEIVMRKLLKDTPWAGLNIESILKRIPDVKKTRLRIAANRSYGLMFAINLISIGRESEC